MQLYDQSHKPELENRCPPSGNQKIEYKWMGKSLSISENHRLTVSVDVAVGKEIGKYLQILANFLQSGFLQNFVETSHYQCLRQSILVNAEVAAQITSS